MSRFGARSLAAATLAASFLFAGVPQPAQQVGAALGGGSTFEVQVGGRAGVPADAEAVVLNVTTDRSSGSGYVTAYPCGSSRPTASSLNYSAGSAQANLSVVQLGAGGKVCFFVSSPTDLIVDVGGWFPAGSDYVGRNPARLADTRSAAALGGGSTFEVQVGGRAGVPADAEAVVLNVTTDRSSGSGYVTAYPCGSSRPTASSLNYSAGSAQANLSVVQLGAGGKVCFFVSSPTDLIVDVGGWFPAGSDYVGRNPARLADTRSAAALGGGSTFEVQVGGRAGVPADAEAVVLNVTTDRSSGSGYVTAYPCGSSRPTASSLNYSAGSAQANLSVVQLGAGGKVCFFVSSPTDLIVDVGGWFPAGSDYVGRNPARLADTRSAAASTSLPGVKWSEVSAGLQREATIVIPDGIYPNAAGVTFHKNGQLNRTDLTGPQEPGTGRYQFWPAVDLSVGDSLTATWTDRAGASHTSTHVVTASSGATSSSSGATSSSSGTDKAPTAPSAPGKVFFEGFESMSWDAFRTGVFHRDADAHGSGLGAPGERTWPGDHDLSCGSPATKRTLDKTDRAGSFYVCNPGPSGTNQHGMTSMGPVDGYSVVWFAPKQTFSSVSEVCWDVNISTNVLGHRQWWEVSISPVGGPDVTAISWLAGTANLPNYGDAGAVVLGFGPDNPPYAKLSVGNTVVGGTTTNDSDGRNSVMIRRPHCLADNGNGTITYTTINGDGSGKSFTAPGSFPAGELKVVFKDHNYTPNKDCGHMAGGVCGSYTWHWDNIAIRN